MIKAKNIAKKFHEGQTDLSGKPYFGHLERVASNFEDEKHISVAYLHDVLEDTDCTAEYLSEHFDKEVVEAIKAMTKRPGDEYFDYLQRVKNNKIARKIKMADLRDNMDPSRIRNKTEKDIKRIGKYKKAYKILSK